MTAKHFRVINGRGSENACEHLLGFLVSW